MTLTDFEFRIGNDLSLDSERMIEELAQSKATIKSIETRLVDLKRRIDRAEARLTDGYEWKF